MTVLAERVPHSAGFIIEEAPMNYCRKKITLVQSQHIYPGSLLEASTTKATLRTTGTVIGIALYEEVTAAGEEKDIVMMFRGPAVVNKWLIDWNKFTAGTPGHTGSGNGAMTMASPAFSVDCKPGIWKARCVAEATDAGTFDVIDPDGLVVGQATVGVAYTGAIKFTIADGSTDAKVGDEFTVDMSFDNATEITTLVGLGIEVR